MMEILSEAPCLKTMGGGYSVDSVHNEMACRPQLEAI